MKQMRIKHNETGRSMVEMLGVLAIMGVLSIGGVAGYRYAVDKMNANEIINELKKRAITASQQRVLGQGINLSEYGVGAKIKGTYTVTPTTNYDGNTSQFALAVAGVPERVCDMILESDWALPTAMAVNGGSCVERANGNTMTFAFNNTLGSGDAGNGETPVVSTEATTEVTATETEVSESDEMWTDLDKTATETEVTETESTITQTEATESDEIWTDLDETEVSESDEIWTELDETVTESTITEPEITETVTEPDCGEHGTWIEDESWAEDGYCHCDTGWTGTYCDASTCNGHGTWNASTKTCTCSSGWTGTYCETEEVDCGEHGTWNSSTERCTCSAGWGGSLCSVALCSEHGTWDSSTKQCVCEEGWTGNTCSVEISCNGHGTWDSSTQQCVCDEGWSTASFCSAKTCQHGTWDSSTKRCVCEEGWSAGNCSINTSCNGHGTWNSSTKECTCSSGWTGTYCETEVDCGEHGTWDSSTQQCICDEGWTGYRCDRNTLCSGNGIWNGSSCECDKGYGGDDCSLEPYCRWTGWLDSGKPNYTKKGSDIESLKDICSTGWVAGISCRAAMFPNTQLSGIEQNVICNTEQGFACYNADQVVGGTTPPACLNYEINVYCCF